MTVRRAGFTLVEVLVVIAIISILAAILFPVVSRARENARRISCTSNLQQLAIALKAYKDDYNGLLVNWCVTHANPNWAPANQHTPDPGVVTWDISLGRYMRGSKAILCCPSNDNDVAKRGARAYAIAQYTQKQFGTRYYGQWEGDIPNPVETVLLFEKGNYLPGCWADALGQNLYESSNGPLRAAYNPGPGGDQIGSSPTINVRMFHFDGKNLLFVDGHAKFYTKTTGPFARMGVSTAVPGMVETVADLPPAQ